MSVTLQASDAVMALAEERLGARPISAHSPLNEVVCGAMMLAYERAGRWEKVSTTFLRARLRSNIACVCVSVSVHPPKAQA